MGAFDADLKRSVWLRDEGRCWRCGGAVWEGDIHHRLARKMGGANARVEWINWVANLLTMHRGCHDWAEAHPEHARAAGWVLSAHQHPEDVLAFSQWDGLWFRLHGPQLYKDPITGILGPAARVAPPTWGLLGA